MCFYFTNMRLKKITRLTLFHFLFHGTVEKKEGNEYL